MKRGIVYFYCYNANSRCESFVEKFFQRLETRNSKLEPRNSSLETRASKLNSRFLKASSIEDRVSSRDYQLTFDRYCTSWMLHFLKSRKKHFEMVL